MSVPLAPQAGAPLTAEQATAEFVRAKRAQRASWASIAGMTGRPVDALRLQYDLDYAALCIRASAVRPTPPRTAEPETRRNLDARSHSATLLCVLSESGPLHASEVAGRMGWPVSRTPIVAGALRSRGLATGGAGRDRVLEITEAGRAQVAAWARAAQTPAAVRISGLAAQGAQMLEVLVQGPADTRELARVIGRDVHQANAVVKRLESDGKVVGVSRGGGRRAAVWALAASVTRVMEESHAPA